MAEEAEVLQPEDGGESPTRPSTGLHRQSTLFGGQPASIDENGFGFVFYPSGRIAASINNTHLGRLSMFMADDERGTLLASFDNDGVGSLNFLDGRPRLVVNLREYMLSNDKGAMVRKVTWEKHKAREPLELEVNEHLTCTFLDRQNITMTVKTKDVHHEFKVGDTQRRTDSYLDGARRAKGGKVELDVEQIRGKPSLYHTQGPHSKVTVKPGFGSLRSMLSTMTEPSLMELTSSLSSTQDRLFALQKLPPVSLAPKKRNGKTPLRLDAQGGGFVFYPSGRIAASISNTGVERLSMFMVDDDKATVVASFDSSGLGGVNFPDGRPRLVLTTEGYSLNDDKGAMVQKSTWDKHKAQDAVDLKVTESISVSFVDRGNITVVVKLKGASHEFKVGQGQSGSADPSYFEDTLRSSSTALGSTGVLGSTAGSAAELPPLELSETQRRLGRSLHRLDPNSKSRYVPKRRRLPQVRLSALDALLAARSSEALTLVVCLVDWVPICRRVQSVVECAYHDATVKARAAEKEDAPYSVVRVDTSESRLLNHRYGFRTAPMFLVYQGSKLVHASNTMTDKGELESQMDRAISAAQRGVFLPPDFKFTGATKRDNAILHCAM